MAKNYANHIKTPRSLVVMFDNAPPVTVLSSDPVYRAVSELIHLGKFREIATAIDKAYALYTQSNGKFVVRNGRVNIDGEELPKTLSDRLLQFVEAKIPTEPLEKFWDNLRQNPSEESKKDLFTFLEKNHIPLTEDGCFTGYKKVRRDYKDIYTGQMDNSPGKVVSMPRGEINPSRHEHCSRGLHVAAWGYAQHTYKSDGVSGDRMLKVKVNPKDVVAVPTDYNAQKMRVCRYQVIEDLSLSKTNEPISDLLTSDETKPGEPGEPVSLEDAQPTAREAAEAAAKRPPSKRKPRTPEPVGKAKFKVAKLSADNEGRLRIPGFAVRQLGVGVGKKVLAVIASPRSRNIKLIKATKDQLQHKFFEARVYVAAMDNSVRLPAIMLEKAKMLGKDYTVRLTNGELEIR